VSATAIDKARQRHPQPEFVVGGIDNFELLRQRRPDVVVMAEITWYVLDQLPAFLRLLRVELPHVYLLHLLNTYPPGVQKYGADHFTDLAGIRRYFNMRYLESGEVQLPGGRRTWFLGTNSHEAEAAWSAQPETSGT
jgi:hypothetical protein